MNVRVSLLLLTLVSTAGCSALTPITTLLDLTEAHEAVQKDKEQPTEIQTVITKDAGQVTVKSNSDKSLVEVPEIIRDQSPAFDVEKAVDGVPTWLIVFNIILGLFVFINSIRTYYNNKKAR